MSRKSLIYIISISLLIISTAYYVYVSNQKPAEKKASSNIEKVKYVNSISAKYDSYELNLELLGRANSFEKVDLYSEVQGILKTNSANFKVGSKFSKGQMLIQIDDENAELNLKSIKSKFLSTLTSIMPDIKNDYKQFFDSWNTYLNEFSINDNIKELPKYDDKLKFYLSNKSIFTSYYEIKNLESNLQKYKIYAPFKGFITESNIANGGLVRPAQKLGQISSSNSYELELSVDINDKDLVKIGQVVEVFDESNNLIGNGKVSRLSGNVDINTQTIKAFVLINSDKIFDGMYLKGEVKGLEFENVVKINRAALFNNTYVYIIDKNGKLDKKEVKVVRLSESIAFVNDIPEGTEIINEALANVQIGLKVKSVNN